MCFVAHCTAEYRRVLAPHRPVLPFYHQCMNALLGRYVSPVSPQAHLPIRIDPTEMSLLIYWLFSQEDFMKNFCQSVSAHLHHQSPGRCWGRETVFETSHSLDLYRFGLHHLTYSFRTWSSIYRRENAISVHSGPQLIRFQTKNLVIIVCTASFLANLVSR